MLKKIAEEKEGAGVEAQEGTSENKPKMDPAYRKKLKKLMNLADKLPNSLVIQPSSSKVQNSDSEGDSSGSAKATDSDDEVPNQVNADSSKSDHGQMGLTSSDDSPRYSRGEKKARRLLMKLDLKRVEGVFRVTMKKSKNILLIIEKPDVYMTPTGAVIVFGRALVEDLNNTAATQAAERYRDVETSKTNGTDKAAATVAAGAAVVDDDDGDEVDEAAAKALDEKDIELVQMQATCSRNKAIKALLQNEHDVVNAIMALTMG
ncbi:hypothetical protein KR032_000752 [Drosophila birchii]|nr:hypothetical protein KR032_000752 [Drosophila birchii]